MCSKNISLSLVVFITNDIYLILIINIKVINFLFKFSTNLIPKLSDLWNSIGFFIIYKVKM